MALKEGTVLLILVVLTMYIIIVGFLGKIYLNNNNLAVQKCKANQIQGYKQPKHLISRKVKTKLCIPLL